ncbi:MAG TPA: hypothetical protein VFR24_25220 [Candidatus Angelobacter sp.]|nr:hypothetical protein [Candidatus Angelobacter sp.]
MEEEQDKLVPTDYVIESIKADLASATPSRRKRIFEAIAIAALGGIPWVGGVIAAASVAADKIKSGEETAEKDSLLREWLQEHQKRLVALRATLDEMACRLEGFGEAMEERIISEDYLTLVRKTFREWDEADTKEKRRLLVNLITNAAGKRLVSDDIVRLFLDWIDTYHESHFAVIREIYRKGDTPPTRYDIWVAIYGEPVPRDSSGEADLFRMLIRDLSTGGVIRQPRETDYQGQFLKKRIGGPRRASSSTMESAFEDTKQYVLTELGSRFVHYTMTELVKQIGGPPPEEKK